MIDRAPDLVSVQISERGPSVRGHAIVDAIARQIFWHRSWGRSAVTSEVYYLARGAAFGKTGTFKPGYSADYIVVDDSCWATDRYDLSGSEQFIYAGSGDRTRNAA